ncbi:MAG TPA: hypothetical protein VK400_14605 [Pyrinomonadaceae bacterium]|nr:hypothetical protein [Pyrinomonadaceae bacterium]
MNRKFFFAVLSLILVSIVIIGVGAFVRNVGAQSFDACITDDGSGASLRFNSGNGDYMFCAGGKTFTGTGAVTKMGRVITLQHNTADRRLAASVNLGTRTGSGMIQTPVGKTVGSISDSNTADSNCQCR